MTKKVTLILSIFSVFLLTRLSAQQPVYFTGLGRALVANDGMKDQSNVASKEKASAGYTLFDLGIYAKPNEVLRGGVILRTKNQFGGFYGDGAALTFRQMQMEGLIAKKVKYEIGDIYLTHTRYTLWNDDSSDTKYESSIFSLRRGIVKYENFYVGNAWRMQGVNAKGKIDFAKGIEYIGIRAYGGRTMSTNFTTIPDRYFYGGRLELMQSKYFRIAGNIASLSDIPGTVKAAQVDYNNMVYTTDFDLAYDNDKFRAGILGEAGISQLEVKRASDSTDNKMNDYFFDMGAKATYKPWNFNIGASYRNVGFNFNSPMAQTRRMADPSTITLTNFPNLNNGTTGRQVSLFDMYSQENNMYNQSIATTLMKYYIQYNMVEPYGRATPNRKGYTFDANIKDPNGIISAGAEVNLLSEIVSEGDSLTNAKRKFMLIRSGATLNIHKLINFEKVIAINGGYRAESSKRGGVDPVHLTSGLIDLGLDVEVLKSLHLLGGMKMFKVSGNEIQSGRNQLNQIYTYSSGVYFNQTQNIIATGLRYDYDKAGYFSVHYNIVKYDDKLTTTNTYNLNQLFFVFGLRF
jgi:hypothetical protein